MEQNETDVMRIAAYAASDLSPWGMALGEMLRAVELVDKSLAAAVVGHALTEATRIRARRLSNNPLQSHRKEPP